MFCENCGTKLPDVARYCENCGNALSYVRSVSLRTDEAILREHPVVERKTVSSSKTIVWILAVLTTVIAIVFLIMQKWIKPGAGISSLLYSMDYTTVNSASLFDIFKTIKLYADSDVTGGITLAGGFVTVLAAVNFICIINAGLGALMLLIKKSKAAKGFAVTALSFYTLLVAAVYFLVYYINRESGAADYSINLLEIDKMVYIGFLPMIASVVLSHMSCKRD